MSEQKINKPWYKKWWGIVVIIMFWPILVPVLTWTKTSWNKWIKITITALCVILIVSTAISGSLQNQEAQSLVKQAETYIDENRVDEALAALKKSKELDPQEDTNSAFALEKEINKLQSEDFLRSSLLSFSDADFEFFKSGKLKPDFIKHVGVNKLFTIKLKENADKRAIYIAEAEEKKKQELAEAERRKKQEEAKKRKEMIEKQFSPWDGAHIKLTKMIKESMNDPDSFQHAETKYWDMKDHLIVNETFRGKNAFGGVVKTTVKARVSLDGEEVEILEQY